MTRPTTTRRRNFFIKKSFQSSFAWRFAALIALEAFLISGLFLFYVSRGTLTTGYSGMELRIERTASFFFTSFLFLSAITAIAMALVAMLVFVVLSHRIAGPVYRLQKSLHEIRHGNLTYQIRLRRKDELGDLAFELNRMAQFLDDKVGEMKGEIRRSAKGTDLAALRRLQDLADTFKTSD